MAPGSGADHGGVHPGAAPACGCAAEAGVHWARPIVGGRVWGRRHRRDVIRRGAGAVRFAWRRRGGAVVKDAPGRQNGRGVCTTDPRAPVPVTARRTLIAPQPPPPPPLREFSLWRRGLRRTTRECCAWRCLGAPPGQDPWRWPPSARPRTWRAPAATMRRPVLPSFSTRCGAPCTRQTGTLALAWSVSAAAPRRLLWSSTPQPRSRCVGSGPLVMSCRWRSRRRRSTCTLPAVLARCVVGMLAYRVACCPCVHDTPLPRCATLSCKCAHVGVPCAGWSGRFPMLAAPPRPQEPGQASRGCRTRRCGTQRVRPHPHPHPAPVITAAAKPCMLPA